MNKSVTIIVLFIITVFGGLIYITFHAKEQESLALLTTEIINTNERLIQAYQNNDVESLEGLLALGHIHNNIFGMTQDRETFLNDIRKGILHFEYYRNSEFNIRFYSNNDICVATGIIEAKAVRSGKVIEGKFRFTRIFLKQGGYWREELFQNTMVVSGAVPNPA
jgi:amino acid permease